MPAVSEYLGTLTCAAVQKPRYPQQPASTIAVILSMPTPDYRLVPPAPPRNSPHSIDPDFWLTRFARWCVIFLRCLRFHSVLRRQLSNSERHSKRRTEYTDANGGLDDADMDDFPSSSHRLTCSACPWSTHITSSSLIVRLGRRPVPSFSHLRATWMNPSGSPSRPRDMLLWLLQRLSRFKVCHST